MIDQSSPSVPRGTCPCSTPSCPGNCQLSQDLAMSMAALPHIPVIQAHNVPYGAGMDQAGTKIYLDPEFPPQDALHSGRIIDTIPPTAIHEITETRYLQHGVPYQQAHPWANRVESAYLSTQGLSPAEINEYEERLRPDLRKVRRWTGQPPPDLNPKPYSDSGELHLLRPPLHQPYQSYRDEQGAFPK